MHFRVIMNRLIVSIITLLFCVVTFSSCKKMKENRLEGTWKHVSYSAYGQGFTTTWTFSKNGDFTETFIDNTKNTSDIRTGTYTIRVNGLKTFIDIFDVYLNTDGKYQIVKLSNKILKTIQISDINGTSQYIRKDFVKD